MPFYSLDIINERISDKQTILSRREVPEARLHLLKKYNVRFLLLRRSDYDLFKNLSQPTRLCLKLQRLADILLLRSDNQLSSSVKLA